MHRSPGRPPGRGTSRWRASGERLFRWNAPGGRLQFQRRTADTTGVVRHWVIVDRQHAALFEALAAAFWDRKGHSVVLDRRSGEERRRPGRLTAAADRRKPEAAEPPCPPFRIVAAANRDVPRDRKR